VEGVFGREDPAPSHGDAASASRRRHHESVNRVRRIAKEYFGKAR
jgi:hypothetical protein